MVAHVLKAAKGHEAEGNVRLNPALLPARDRSDPQVAPVRVEAGHDFRRPASLDGRVARMVPVAAPCCDPPKPVPASRLGHPCLVEARLPVGKVEEPGAAAVGSQFGHKWCPRPESGTPARKRAVRSVCILDGTTEVRSASASVHCCAGHSRACPGSEDRLQRIVLCHPVARPDFLKPWSVVRLPASGWQKPEGGCRFERRGQLSGNPNSVSCPLNPGVRNRRSGDEHTGIWVLGRRV